MTDLAIVAFVAVLVFAATRIPALGDALGRTLRRGARPADAGAPPPCETRPPADEAPPERGDRRADSR